MTDFGLFGRAIHGRDVIDRTAFWNGFRQGCSSLGTVFVIVAVFMIMVMLVRMIVIMVRSSCLSAA